MLECAQAGAGRERSRFKADVNEKYGPWLAKSERLYEAMNTLDTVAQRKRGLLLIE